MSLNPQPGYTVPAETGFVAKAIFPKGNLCITMADRLDSFVSDQDFSILFSKQGQPGVSPMRLALATRSDLRWQSRAGKGFAASDFKVDWLQQVAICPEGKTSTSWTPAIDGRDNEVIKIKFARSDCATCPSLHLCTRTKEKRRLVTLRKEAQYKALQAARKQAMSDEYKADYARRAGIEATLSESIRAHGLRHARYIGLAKTHLQHLMTATAINFKRIFHWLSGIPQATTRTGAICKAYGSVGRLSNISPVVSIDTHAPAMNNFIGK